MESIKKTYQKVKVICETQLNPVWMFSELNDSMYETRKVDVFRNGECGFSDGNEQRLAFRHSLRPRRSS